MSPTDPDTSRNDESASKGQWPTDPAAPHPAADPETAIRICRNCGSELHPADKYCGQCRQKYTTAPASMRELFSDFFDTLFNIDNRVLQSLLALFVPGRLTNRYVAGIQRRYLSPIRFFFVSAIVSLACVGFAVNDILEKEFAKTERQQARAAYHDLLVDELREGRDSLLTLFANRDPLPEAMDSLIQIMGAVRNDTVGYGYMRFNDNGAGIITENVSIAAQDLVLMPIDELLDHYEVEGFWRRLQMRQLIKINRNGSSAVGFLIGQSVWAILLIVPFLAALLKLLYIRRKRYYVEHFVFTLHMHTFLFVIGSLALLLFLGFDVVWPFIVGGAAFVIYLYLSMLRVYGQGWFKTLVKYAILGICYWIFLGNSFVLVLLISVLLY